MNEHPLTVAQLIALLRDQPQDAVIDLEGCDCWGRMGSLRFDAATHRVKCERIEDRHS